MVLNRLIPALVLATTLAGCGLGKRGGPAILPVPSETSAVMAAEAAPWQDATTLSTPDDPAAGPLVRPTVGAPDIVNFKQVNPTLYRGGLPSKDALGTLKGMGIKTDITLMGEVPVYDSVMVAREKKWAKDLGLNFVQVKVPTGRVPFSPKLTNAISNDFLKVVLDPANQPCFVHCLHGRDRTGTMVAVYRMTQNGYTNQQAYDEMCTFGFNKDHYPALAAYVLNFKAGS